MKMGALIVTGFKVCTDPMARPVKKLVLELKFSVVVAMLMPISLWYHMYIKTSKRRKLENAYKIRI